MNFNKLEYIFVSLPICIMLISAFIIKEKNFFSWVKQYWFFQRSKLNKLSSMFFLFGIFILALSVGDLRGPETIVEGKAVESKTLILIDSSASMLAEDVRPNRFEKGLILAKHYLRKAIGQNISIVVFSDQQKRIVPFTSDMNLIEARLSTLEELNIGRGGSNISQALLEAEKYFVGANGIELGNILLITDGEENERLNNLKLSENISLAVLAVGTSKGGVIPLRDSRGKLRGNKKYNGKDIITKIDEGFLKSLGQNVENYRYWITSSYSLPTEEVLKFFNTSMKERKEKNDVRVKPVLYERLLVPALLLLIISYLLKYGKNFNVPIASLLIILSSNLMAKDDPKLEKSQELVELENRFAKDELTNDEKKYLAQKLLSEKFFDQSSLLYDELLKDKIQENNKQEFFNKGAAEFQSGDIAKGIKTYNELIKYLKENKQTESEIYKDVKKNLLKALQTQENQKSKNGDSQDSENKENSEGEKSENSQKSKSNENNENNQQDGNESNQENSDKNEQNQKNKSNNKNENDEKDEKDENADKDKENSEEGKESEKDKKDKNESGDNKSSGGEKKKIPALLKQLMSDDNQLQKKMIDAKTSDRSERDKKDW